MRLPLFRLKARRALGRDGGWHMKAKHEAMVRDLLFYCFVDFGNSLDDPPKCWVIPSNIVADALMKSHQSWLAKPGKTGARTNQTT